MTRDKPSTGTTTVRDELTPELTGNFRYIYGRLVARGRQLGLKFEDAEEYAMDGVLHALRNRHRYHRQEGKPLESWMLTVAHHRFIDLLRKKTPRLLALEESVIVGPDSPQHEEMDDREAAQRRHEILRLLPEEDRLFFLAWAEQHERAITRDEAARRRGLTIGDYENRKKKLRRLLPTLVEKAGYSPEDLFSEEQRRASVQPDRDREA